MAYRVYRWFAIVAGLIFLATQARAQSPPSAVTDAQVRFCLSRTDPQCKRVGLALLDEGRITTLGTLILMRRTPGSPPHGRVFGNPRDYAQASRYWFEKAAQNGNPAALHSLARTHCCIPELGLGYSSTEIQAALPISGARQSKAMHPRPLCLA
jgi:TPR repeat protein